MPDEEVSKIIIALISLTGTIIVTISTVYRRGREHFDRRLSEMEARNTMEHMNNQERIHGMKVDVQEEVREIHLGIAKVDRKIEAHMAYHNGLEGAAK